jgi:hypothetical protein
LVYDAADIKFVEPMLVTSEIEALIGSNKTKYKVIKPISALGDHGGKRSLIDITEYFEVKDFFVINENNYFLLQGGLNKYAIKEVDLNFATKIIVKMDTLLVNALESNDLVLFKKYLNEKNIKEYSMTDEVINTDKIEFFKAVYEKEGTKSLVKALGQAKSNSVIFKYAYNEPLNPEDVSMALLPRLSRGTPLDVQLLIDKGATFNFDDGTQRLSVLQVVHNKKYFNEIIDIYIKNGGDVNAKSRGGKSLFLQSVSISQIQYLLNKGANINDTDDKGISLLLYLAQYINNKDRFLIMRFLVDAGIDKTITNERGFTAYEILKNHYCPDGRMRANKCGNIEYLK